MSVTDWPNAMFTIVDRQCKRLMTARCHVGLAALLDLLHGVPGISDGHVKYLLWFALSHSTTVLRPNA